MEYQDKKIKNKILIIVGLLIILTGISVLIYNYYSHKELEIIENISIDNFIEETITNDKDESNEDSNQNVEETIVINYIGILEIPKINLKKGIVNKEDSLNNVNKNIYILKESILPNEQTNSHILLAAHSGNSYVSFFKNLNKLELNDKVYFYYNNKKYIYKVSDRYEVEKTGKINLKLTNTSDITLITCISRTKKQVVYIATLTGIQEY